jgi:hypothetical protein
MKFILIFDSRRYAYEALNLEDPKKRTNEKRISQSEENSNSEL